MDNLISPREYQIEALEAVVEAQGNGITRQLISLPTGTGKTIVFALLAKEFNCRTLVIAHTEELINQAVEKFKIVWPDVDIGIVKSGSDQLDKKVVVASIQTASREKRLQQLKQQNFGLMIVDEAHHATASTYEKVIKGLGFLENDPEKLLVGVTATPKRSDGIGLGSTFQMIVFERSISTMIRAGYLAPLVGQQIFTQIDLVGVGLQHGDFVQSDLAKVVNTPSRNQLIAENYKQYGFDRKKALAFCVDVQHAKDLANAFIMSGVLSSPIYGSMHEEERKKVISDFEEGKCKVLTNCQLLTEGFDEPSIDCVIMGRPTASTSLFTQMIGRGIRTYPTKKNCLILDFTDNATRHRLCSSQNTLDGSVTSLDRIGGEISSDEYKTSTQDKSIDSWGLSAIRVLEKKIEEIEFFDTTTFSWIPVAQNWHLKLAQNVDVWVKKVNGGYGVTAHNDKEITQLSHRPLPIDYALGIAEDWIRKKKINSNLAKKDAPWRNEPATQKQKDVLSKWGIAFDLDLSKGEACILIDSKANEPATPKQLYFLRKRGSFRNGLTKMEASKMIAEAIGR